MPQRDASPPQGPSFGHYFVPALLAFALGLTLTFDGVNDYGFARTTADWVESSGRIERAEVRETGLRRKGAHFNVLVDYSYEVEATRRVSSRVTVDDQDYYFRDRAKAEAHAARLLRQRDVTIYYDREDPSEVVLERLSVDEERNAILGGLGLVGLGFLVIVAYLWRRRVCRTIMRHSMRSADDEAARGRAGT